MLPQLLGVLLAYVPLGWLISVLPTGAWMGAIALLASVSSVFYHPPQQPNSPVSSNDSAQILRSDYLLSTVFVFVFTLLICLGVSIFIFEATFVYGEFLGHSGTALEIGMLAFLYSFTAPVYTFGGLAWINKIIFQRIHTPMLSQWQWLLPISAVLFFAAYYQEIAQGIGWLSFLAKLTGQTGENWTWLHNTAGLYPFVTQAIALALGWAITVVYTVPRARAELRRRNQRIAILLLLCLALVGLGLGWLLGALPHRLPLLE